jgi:hypothetical protein
MSVHLNSDVVSATMAHLLISQKGSRFSFSHQFKDLLVTQMLNHLNGDVISDFVLRRRNKGKNGELDVWADYSINDYIYRPSCLENISFYQFGLEYQKIPFTFEQMKNVDSNGLPLLKRDELHFQEDHPGRRYCYLKKSDTIIIPKLSIPKGMLCDLDLLELNEEEISEKALQGRMNYAKLAMVLFYPFRDESVLSFESYNSLWHKFCAIKKNNLERTHSDENTFWNKGMAILQNMQDVKQSGRCQIPADPLNKLTTEQDYMITNNSESNPNNTYDSDVDCDYINATGIEEFSFGQNIDYESDLENDTRKERFLEDLMHGRKISDNVLITPRVFTEESFFSIKMNHLRK